LTKFTAAGVSLEVAALIDKSGEKLENSATAQANAVQARRPDYNLAEVFPEAAILNAYQDLSKVLLEIRDKLPDDKPHRNLIEDLRQKKTVRTVALLGVSDLCVVETDDAVLIMPRDRAQDVRMIVDELTRRGGPV